MRDVLEEKTLPGNDLYTIKPVMVTMEKTGYKVVANARINARIKQVVVLILTIIIGILISVSVNQ